MNHVMQTAREIIDLFNHSEQTTTDVIAALSIATVDVLASVGGEATDRAIDMYCQGLKNLVRVSNELELIEGSKNERE